MPSEPNRTVSVPRRRLSGWLNRFAERHPDLAVSATDELVSIVAADDAVAQITVPFPPLAPAADPLRALLTHVTHDRRIGVLLARKGGWAVGLFVGELLTDSKVGSSYVQGTTKAGGWSQQRYARRRANQAQQSADRAAEVCLQLLAPRLPGLDAVILGGHGPAVDQVLADPRLAQVRSRVVGPVLPTPDPRLRVLQAFGPQMLALTIGLNDEA